MGLDNISRDIITLLATFINTSFFSEFENKYKTLSYAIAIAIAARRVWGRSLKQTKYLGERQYFMGFNHPSHYWQLSLAQALF